MTASAVMGFDPNSKDSRSQRSLWEVPPSGCGVYSTGERITPTECCSPSGEGVLFISGSEADFLSHNSLLFLLSQQTLGPHHFPINGYLFRKCKLFLILTNCHIIRVRGCHELNIRSIELLPELRGEASPRTHMAVQTFSTSQGHSGDLGLVNQSVGTGDAVLG